MNFSPSPYLAWSSLGLLMQLLLQLQLIVSMETSLLKILAPGRVTIETLLFLGRKGIIPPVLSRNLSVLAHVKS